MQDPSSRESRSGLLVIALASVAWGTIPLVIRSIGALPVQLPFFDAPYDAAPVVVVFWRVFIAATGMFLFLAVRGRLRSLLEVSRREFTGLVVNGVLLAVHWFLFFSALTLTDVAIAELLTYTGPIYIAALTPLVLKERTDRRVIAPIALALAGMVVILGPQVDSLQSGTGAVGAAMAVLAAVGYAFLMLNAKRLLRGLDPSVVMFWDSSVAALLLLPLVLVLPTFSRPSEWIAVATLGLFHSGLVAFVFLAGLKKVRADHAAVLMYIEPVSAVLFAALFLGEPVGWTTVLGGAAVVGGGMLVARLGQTASVEAPVVVEPQVPDGPGPIRGSGS